MKIRKGKVYLKEIRPVKIYIDNGKSHIFRQTPFNFIIPYNWKKQY